jgi:thiamine biosynthesis lipoprotein
MVSALVSSPSLAEWYSDEQAIMGTAVSVTLWHDNKSKADLAIAAVMEEMRRVDQTFSPYIESSELARVNREAAKGPMSISAELTTIIDKALYFSRLSEGAFDISFASVGRFYDYREKQQPTADQRQQLLEAIDYHLIDLDRAASTVYFKHLHLQIDLGGIAKGYAVDRAIALLQAQGITNASVSAGGDSRLLGDRGNAKPWHIGIKNPRGDRRETDVAILLPLADVAVSTSGDYERFFIDEASGERIHHILNPRTGRSSNGIASVTILGPQGFDTDPLSTAVFVLGVKKGMPLVNKLTGFDCIIIDSAGRVHYSDGLTPPVQTSEN